MTKMNDPQKPLKPYGDISGIITLTNDVLVVRNPSVRKEQERGIYNEKGLTKK